ncbi:Zn-dependent alcohol dehydrogenase [Marinomonas flavescens]|uniref:Zn-dependent alcohol dehydrogenase n=1 Tax=Marinomonas flavescens TaxID=2529379 RepID=UPI0010559D5E|nr:Zn-dependent alcohol dehydrogenase [Marinomonas flavescens]
MLTAKAIISDGKGKMRLTQIQVGDPLDDEVQIQIKASGICHTDWDSIQNWNKEFIVGHEGAGVVTQVGVNVTKVQPGDHVILNWAIPCGRCFQCLEGNVHICENNSPVCGCGLKGHAHSQACLHDNLPLERSFHLGTMSEYTVVKEAAVVKMDKTIPFDVASIIGCGVMTGWGSAVNAANVRAGSTVCVIGCGGVGLNTIQGAAQSGAATIIAIDINQERLDQAKFFGATAGIIVDRDDKDFNQVLLDVLALNQGRAADYAFECTAIPALGSAPLKLIRSAGTAVQVSGIEQRIDFDCELFEWDKIYINPLYGQCNPDRDFPRIISLYQSGKMKLAELVTKTYTLETLSQGFDDMLNGRIAKGVILIGD